MEEDVVREFEGQYRFLSNFWSCYIKVDGDWYPSVENAYQAMKMKHKANRARFQHIKASEAKRLGRLLPMRDDWDQVKLEVMYNLVRQKFEDRKLQSNLLATGDAE